MKVKDFYNSLKFALENKYINEDDFLFVYSHEFKKMIQFNGLALPKFIKIKEIDMNEASQCQMVVFDRKGEIEIGKLNKCIMNPAEVEKINMEFKVVVDE